MPRTDATHNGTTATILKTLGTLAVLGTALVTITTLLVTIQRDVSEIKSNLRGGWMITHQREFENRLRYQNPELSVPSTAEIVRDTQLPSGAQN